MTLAPSQNERHRWFSVLMRRYCRRLSLNPAVRLCFKIFTQSAFLFPLSLPLLFSSSFNFLLSPSKKRVVLKCNVFKFIFLCRTTQNIPLTDTSNGTMIRFGYDWLSFISVFPIYTVKSQTFARYLFSYFRTFEKGTKENTVWKFLFVLRPTLFWGPRISISFSFEVLENLVRTNQFQVKCTKMGTGRKFVTLQ